MKRNARLTLVFLVVAGLLLAACGRVRRAPRGVEEGTPTFSHTAYINEGTSVHLIVDVRASRISGPQNFLPLQVAVLNVSDDPMMLSRESFVLETAGRVSLPLASFREFKSDYRRQNTDARIGREFIATLGGRYPDPPYEWRDLEFFPPQQSGTPPRDSITLRPGQIGIGYVYFSLPDENTLPAPGAAKLLVRPASSDENFVVDMRVYRKVKRS